MEKKPFTLDRHREVGKMLEAHNKDLEDLYCELARAYGPSSLVYRQAFAASSAIRALRSWLISSPVSDGDVVSKQSLDVMEAYFPWERNGKP